MNDSKNRRNTFCCRFRIRFYMLALGFFLVSSAAAGEGSAIDLLAGWDRGRIEAAFQDEDASVRAAELSRLIYRVARHRLSRYEELASLHGNADPSTRQIGDALTCEGFVKSISRVPVPESLVDFVEFDSVYVVSTEKRDDQSSVQVWLSEIPNGLKVGDRFETAGVQLSLPSQPTMIAVPSLKWFPASSPNPGLATLLDAGFDLTLVDRLKRRQREPLEAEDSDAFYGLLGLSPFPLDDAASVSPIQLLTKPAALTGTMVKIRVDIVQSTRIAVASPDRQGELDADHYYQLDGFVSLGDREVVIRSSDADVEPVRFGGRYPISLVSRTVPDALTPIAINGGKQSQLVDVSGVFFRLWSYQSDLMRDSNLDQFGPLVVASDFEMVQRSAGDPVGVNRIGFVAAIALVLGVIAVTIWHLKTSKQDRAIRRRRNELT